MARAGRARAEVTSLLLLSGGLDSACLAALARPTTALFLDYGQRPAAGERRAAHTIAGELSLPLEERSLDLSAIGDGLLSGGKPSQLAVAPTPEWFPFRNQLLVSAAAAVAVQIGAQELWLGLTAEDTTRHADGTTEFVEAADHLLQLQEGGIRLRAPAHHLQAQELLTSSRLPDHIWQHTLSCHVAPVACGECPGCAKRRLLLG